MEIKSMEVGLGKEVEGLVIGISQMIIWWFQIPRWNNTRCTVGIWFPTVSQMFNNLKLRQLIPHSPGVLWEFKGCLWRYICHRVSVCDNATGVFFDCYRRDPIKRYNKLPHKYAFVDWHLFWSTMHDLIDIVVSIHRSMITVTSKRRCPQQSSTWTGCAKAKILLEHDDVIKWKHFPRYRPLVRGIHRSPVNSPHKVQGRGTLMFSLTCASTNSWVTMGTPVIWDAIAVIVMNEIQQSMFLLAQASVSLVFQWWEIICTN